MLQPLIRLRSLTIPRAPRPVLWGLLTALSVSPLIGWSSAEARIQTEESHPDAASNRLLAQVGDESILYFDTETYVVNVLEVGNRLRMNVYNRRTDTVELEQGAVFNQISNFESIFLSYGSRNGSPVTFKAIVNAANQPRLIIEDAAGTTILTQRATNVARVDLSPEQSPRPEQNTILAFETTTYATRVFSRDNEYFMNVYDKFTGDSVQNGVAAELAPPDSPNQRQVSYFSGGQRNGVPVRYFARIDATGQTSLEIVNANGQRIFQEPGIGPAVVNIPPEDLPAGLDIFGQAESAYVVAVFEAEDDNLLQQIQRLYPEAARESSRLGNFINAGAFANRDRAAARVLELRGRGYNARLIYRDVMYR